MKKNVNRKTRGKVFVEIVNQNKFGRCIPVFDWNDLIYCSTKLPIGNDGDYEFEVCIVYRILSIAFLFYKKNIYIYSNFILIIIFR